VAHGIAGWVVKEVLTTKNIPPGDVLFGVRYHTAGVIFVGLPELADRDTWNQFRDDFISTVSRNKRDMRKRSESTAWLDFPTLQLVDNNFERLNQRNQGRAIYSPKVEYIGLESKSEPVSSPALKCIPYLTLER
jgi:hypothetical protein